MKLTVRQVKKVFRKRTHCGKYWGVRPKYNIFTGNVSIEMGENERLVYNMKTGKGRRTDLDDDGCSIMNNYSFIIGKSKKSDFLTILRTP